MPRAHFGLALAGFAVLGSACNAVIDGQGYYVADQERSSGSNATSGAGTSSGGGSPGSGAATSGASGAVSTSGAKGASGAAGGSGSSGASSSGSHDASADAPMATGPDASDGGTCVAGTTRTTLETACTSATCASFTTSVPSCDGSLCALPSPTSGADAGSGTPDASTSAEGGADAAADSTVPSGGPTPCTQIGVDPSKVVYVTGSTALQNFIGEVSKALATEPTNPVTVVYQASGSCVGVKSILDPTNNLLSPAVTGSYYDATGSAQTCAFDPSDPIAADVGASDVFYTTCYLDQPVTPPLPQDVSESYGPVQVMNFAVPEASTRQSISLTAAYYVFGFGGSTYPIPPWTDPKELQIRSSASGTQSMIAAAIGVPAARWIGVSNASSGAVGAALTMAGQSASSATVESALGILASDYLRQSSQTLRGLAVEDRNTSCAFYPSSTATASDFVNVRDGHYPLWGPSHFYTHISPQTQTPTKPGASQLIDGLSGLTTVPGLNLLAEYASKGLIPLCAMHVSRSTDGGDYSPSQPPLTCNCYFDLIATGQTSCKTCSSGSDCPASAPNCNKFGPAPQQGYCDL